MDNFLTKFREYYDIYFPAITDENIVKRTFIFYVLLYLSLFFTGFTIGAVSTFNIILTVSLYLMLGLTGSNFILYNKVPNPKYVLKILTGFNIFMFAFVIYIGFLFLFGSFIYAFDINFYEYKHSYKISFILLGIFLFFSFGTLFYYMKNGAKGIYKFVSEKSKKNVTTKK